MRQPKFEDEEYREGHADPAESQGGNHQSIGLGVTIAQIVSTIRRPGLAG